MNTPTPSSTPISTSTPGPQTIAAPIATTPPQCNVLRDTSADAPATESTATPRENEFIANQECNVLRDTFGGRPVTVIELRVRNHPGTMSHITGLFARRAFNLDAIVCVPIGDGSTSRMLLLVSDHARLEQLERQLAKLHDVLDLRHRPDLDAGYFNRLAVDA